jgi:hypothetical protein
MLRQEFEALRANPWGYIRDKHGVDARTVAEAELFHASDESAAMRAERLAQETQKRLDDVLNHVRSQQDREQKVAQWEAAKSAALKEYESKASTAYADLDAWATKQAARTGTSKSEIVVDEMLSFVDRLKKDDRFKSYVDQYSDAEILAAVSQRFEGAAEVGKPKPKHDTRTLSRDDTMTKIPKGSVESNEFRRKEAREIVAAWKAARGDQQEAPSRPYTLSRDRRR